MKTRGRPFNPRSKVCFNVSDSEVERTDSDRSRTPSPFLSSNKYYPWLYGKKQERDGDVGDVDGDGEGIYLENSKITDDEDNDEEDDSPQYEAPKEDDKDPEDEDAAVCVEEEKNHKACENKKSDKPKVLSKFLDKVISSLKTQKAPQPVPPPASQPQPVPPPPSQPQPVPPPPSQPPTEPQPVPPPPSGPPMASLAQNLKLFPPPPPPPEHPPQPPRPESPEPGEIVDRERSYHQYDPNYGRRGHSLGLMSEGGIDQSAVQ